MTPDNLKYTDSHEWVKTEADGTCSVGITFHAQDMLGDVVFVENPVVGRKVKKGEECGVIESVKAAADIYAPLSGEIVATNGELAESPEKINEDPYSAWMFRIRPEDPRELAGLLDAGAYDKVAAAEKH
ncbi:MAG: glycine cleavage system H-protein [Betaproteobacteria bacterium]|jgi:glycine cleavage system H protein|nr:glycine cleavage system H-protein [Betaproteobacteria bacterium]MEA3155015.1 glycine cleavage system protein [Betaproteobacteria bacterium]